MTYLIPSASFVFDIALGNVAGYSVVHKWGRNDAVGTSVEDVWSGGGAFPYPSGAESLEINAAAAADDATGTGAQTVTVEGLDGSYDEKTDTQPLTGGGNVTLSGTWIRVNRAFVVTAGSGGTNAGLLTIRVQGGGATRARVETGVAQTQQTNYTIPNAKTGLVWSFWAEMLRGNPASTLVDVTLVQRPDSGVWREFHIDMLESGTQSPSYAWLVPQAFPAKTDLAVRAIRTGGTDSQIAAGYTIILKDD